MTDVAQTLRTLTARLATAGIGSPALDATLLGEHFRRLQQELHPDRFAGASDHEQRVAVQYSGLVNQAYTTLRHPLPRALYLLQLRGMSRE